MEVRHHHRPVRHVFNDRLQLSVHYASTPALSNANSVEENSVNSEDFEISSSSSSQNSSRFATLSGLFFLIHFETRPLLLRNPHHIDEYQPSNVSISSSSHYTTGSSSVAPNSPYLYKVKTRPTTVSTRTVAGVNRNKLRKIHRPKSLFQLDQSGLAQMVPKPEVMVTNTPYQEESKSTEAATASTGDLTVTEADLRAIDTCYRGHKTKVFVCTALANLYKSRKTLYSSQDNWDLSYTGIPVLLLDTGTTRSRLKRQIQVRLKRPWQPFMMIANLNVPASSGGKRHLFRPLARCDRQPESILMRRRHVPHHAPVHRPHGPHRLEL